MRLVVRRILGADDHRKTVNELLTSHDAFNSVTKFARHDPLSHSCRLQGSNHRMHTLVEHREACHDLIGSLNALAGRMTAAEPAGDTAEQERLLAPNLEKAQRKGQGAE